MCGPTIQNKIPYLLHSVMRKNQEYCAETFAVRRHFESRWLVILAGAGGTAAPAIDRIAGA
jgi:hypothetical protein